jgi:hypothetical protein
LRIFGEYCHEKIMRVSMSAYEVRCWSGKRPCGEE